jgi:rod shape-determining protein MreC
VLYPLTSEVTLLVDKDAAIPVLNTRTQQRSAAFGGAGRGRGAMELRFMSGNADVQGAMCCSHQRPGRRLPAGPAGGPRGQRGAPRRGRLCPHRLVPLAPPDGVRHVLVLEPAKLQLPPRPNPPTEPAKAERQLGSPARRAASSP